MCARQHDLAEVACYRLERTLVENADPLRRGIGAPRQCPLELTKNEVGERGWGLTELSLATILIPSPPFSALGMTTWCGACIASSSGSPRSSNSCLLATEPPATEPPATDPATDPLLDSANFLAAGEGSLNKLRNLFIPNIFFHPLPLLLLPFLLPLLPPPPPPP